MSEIEEMYYGETRYELTWGECWVMWTLIGLGIVIGGAI